VAEWRATLRAEVKVARLLLRRCIGPLTMPEDSPRPEWIEAVADVKTGLLDGLVPHDVTPPASTTAIHDVASPTFASWNQIGAWLNRLDALRRAA